MEQRYSSARTSINGKQGKMPTLYNKITFEPGTTVVDYGCGNGTELLEAKAKADGAEWYGYDLNWKPDQETLDRLEKGVDLSVCCNLLNVIDSVDEIKRIICLLINNSKETLIQVYTGDGKGVGKANEKLDSYQQNKSIGWYADLVRELGYNAVIKNGIIKCNK